MLLRGLLLLPALAAQASAGRVGPGVMLGEPTGLDGKLWLNKTHAVDGGLAWSLSEHQPLHLHADYLFQNARALAGSGLPCGLSSRRRP